jgi:hypothetical protein
MSKPEKSCPYCNGAGTVPRMLGGSYPCKCTG